MNKKEMLDFLEEEIKEAYNNKDVDRAVKLQSTSEYIQNH